MTHSTMPEDRSEIARTHHEEQEADMGQDAGPTTDRRVLRRSKQNRVLGGVCGGIGRYIDVDPILFRIAFLLLLIPAGLGFFLYVIAWIVIPEFRSEEDEHQDSIRRPLNRQTAGAIIGGLLIVAGSLLLIERLVDWFDPQIIGGVVLVMIGAFVVWRGLRSEAGE